MRFLKPLIILSVFCAAIFIMAKLPVLSDPINYESRGKRDPFIPLVGIDKPAVSKLEDVTSVNDLRLEGIVSAPTGGFMAVLNGELVKTGNRFGDIVIDAISKKNVRIFMGGKTYTIDFSE